MNENENTSDSIIKGELLLFRTLWNNSNDNMFIVSLDKNGDFVSESSNRAQEKTFSLSPNQLDGVRLKDIFDAKTYKLISDRYNQCISLNKPISYEESATIDDIGERYWNTTILPVVDSDGSVRIFGLSKEFTELKRTSKELELANETLELKVEERTKELSASLDEIRRISIHDNMTGLYNRMKLDESLEYEVKRASRNNEKLGLILLDIDLFKNINDTYGHQVGDSVLIELANLLKSNIRSTDVIGRWGGEEFLIIAPNTDMQGADNLAENIRKEIEHFKFTNAVNVTASFGVTTYSTNDTPDSMIKRADDALYEAKNSSRNCVINN